MNRRRGIVFAGGGTAGHLQPALAIAQSLVALGHDKEEIHFFGSRRGMEERLLASNGFTLTRLPGRGLKRRVCLQNVAALSGLFVAFWQSLGRFVLRRPAVVISVGGYASLACSLAALVLRIPLVVVTVDALPGATNRLIGRFATLNAVAYGGTDLPRQIVTGAPLRAQVAHLRHDRAQAAELLASLKIAPTARLVVVTGGSLGAWRLNQAALALARALASRGEAVVYHVAGERDYPRVLELAQGLGLLERKGASVYYKLVAFEERLPELLARADLVLARAGAMTIAELAAIGTPAVLVPLPNSPGDHQRKNAEVLVQAGAAVLVTDEHATPSHLAEVATELLFDAARLEQMGAAAHALGRSDGAEHIARAVENLILGTGERLGAMAS